MSVLDGIVSVPLLPVVIASTFLLGILVTITFGLLLIPISLVWLVLFLGPLTGLSWLWLKVPILRLPVAILGVPWAVLAGAYAGLMPSMGDTTGRMAKLLLASSWPYTSQVWRWQLGKMQWAEDAAASGELFVVLDRETRGNPQMRSYVESVNAQYRTAATEAVLDVDAEEEASKASK